jgi:hypothetical protein
MSVRPMDDLINAVWNVMDDECDQGTVQQWRIKALKILNDYLGPDHYYTQSLKKNFDELARRSLLAAGGILIAAREELSRTGAGAL